MRSSLSVTPAVLCLLSGAVFYTLLFNVEPPGFCESKGRVLSDMEFTKAAFNMLALQRRDYFVDVGDPLKVRRKLYDERYSTWSSNFNAENCCAVIRESGFWRRLFGMQTVVVEIWPRPEAGDERIMQTYDVCGWLGSSDSGTPDSLKRPINVLEQGLQDQLRLTPNWSERNY